MIESIDFYPGNFSTYYGRSIGGVIDLRTRSPRDDRFHGMIDADLLDTGVLIEGPVTEDLSIALSGRRSYFDIFLPFILPDDGPDVFVAPRYYDYQGWVTYRGFEDHKIEIFVYGSDDQVAVILPKGEPEGNAEVQVTGIDLTNGFVRGQLNWKWRPRLPVENTFFASLGRNYSAFELAENFFFEFDGDITQVRDDLRLKLAEDFELRLGADLVLGRYKAEFQTPRFENDGDRDPNGNGRGRPNFDRDGQIGVEYYSQMQPAFYVEPEIRLFDRLLLVPGLRIDHYGQIGQTTLSPRMSFRLDVVDRVVAKGGVGYFNQPPVPSAESELFGNPNIQEDRAIQYAIGAEYMPVDFLSVDLTLYYRDAWNLLNPSTDFEVDDSGETKNEVFNNDGEARSYGMELLVRHYPQNRFFGWLAYTLSRSERLNTTTGEFDLYQYDQTHILTLVAGYNLPFNFDVSGRFRLATGNPFTPVVGGVYNVDDDSYEQVFGERNSARNRTFHQLDLRVDKKFIFESWTLGLYLDVQNVYYATNQEGTRYNYDFSDSEPVSGLPIVPSLGIMGKF
jgi:hypothetical protein